MLSAPTFYVVPGSTVKRVIDDNKKQVFDAVEGHTVFTAPEIL